MALEWLIVGAALGAGGMYLAEKSGKLRRNPTGEVEVIGQTGDAHALDFGGGVVYLDEYGAHWEWWDELLEHEGETEYEVYRAKVPDNVLTKYKWADHKAVVDSAGMDLEEYEALATSNDPLERVGAMEMIVSYYGGGGLDQSPVEYTRKELKARWPHLR